MVAGDIMTRDVITTTPSACLGEIVARMLGNKVKHLPILEAGKIVGIISSADIVRTLSETLGRKKG